MEKDQEIQKDVMEELKWTPLLDATEIGVSVKDGVVALSGTVDSYTKKLEAEKAAKRINGVRAVAENIIVKLSSEGEKTDAEIAQAVLNTLYWNSSVPHDKIKITVEKGWVTMEGEVEWDYQRTAARIAIEMTIGVAGVLNNIKVKPRLSPEKIREKIVAAFNRNANIDAAKIRVETIGDTVVLSGMVPSFDERTEAEDAAWVAPGVKWVENTIAVEPEVYAF